MPKPPCCLSLVTLPDSSPEAYAPRRRVTSEFVKNVVAALSRPMTGLREVVDPAGVLAGDEIDHPDGVGLAPVAAVDEFA